jgi:hypothetical protein
MQIGDRRHTASEASGAMIPASSAPSEGPSTRRSTMAEKRIQPKAADTESTMKKSAAAGVEKKSLKHRSAKLAKKHAGR